MKYHQGIRAEVDARGKSFSTCVELGKKLLQRKHQDSPEVRAADGAGRQGGWCHWGHPVTVSPPLSDQGEAGGAGGEEESHDGDVGAALGPAAAV